MAVAIKGIVDQNGVTHRFDHEYLENNPPIPEIDTTTLNKNLNYALTPISDSVPVDISSQSTTKTSGTSNGITWTKNSENNWTATGTASGFSSINIIGNTSSLIARFYKGQSIKVVVNTTDENIKVNVYIKTAGSETAINYYLNETTVIRIPDDVTAVLIRLCVSSGYTVNGTIAFSLIGYFNTYIQSTNDTTDRTAFIKKILDYAGSVKLGKGTFYVKDLIMSEGQSISGEGSKSVLRLADNGTFAVKMATYSKLSNLRIIGADEDIVLPTSDFTPGRSDVDVLDGVNWINWDGYTYATFTNGVPSGTYYLTIDATSDREDVDYVIVKLCSTTTYGAANVVSSFYVDKNTPIEQIIDLSGTVKSIWIFAASTVGASSGYAVTLNSAEMYGTDTLFGTRSGVVWTGETTKYGTITNCLIERFDCAGILAYDTFTPVDNNLYISDCFVRNCLAGVYVKRDSEFLRICNNTFARNYFGILTRGGNNYICNCGLDSNVVDIQVDNEEGSNGGHGSISNCSINHADGNNGYGLIIKSTGRMLVANCNFYYSKVLLKSTMGNVLTGCGFGNSAKIIVDVGSTSCNIINGCMFKTASGAIEASGRTKVVNCFSRSGAEITLPS